jgi:hypothetical protein
MKYPLWVVEREHHRGIKGEYLMMGLSKKQPLLLLHFFE